LLDMRAKRMNLIQHCVEENRANITRLREKDAPLGLRVIRSELDVEGIVNERSEKAVHDRCRTFL
uniref:Coiled-coil domain-containing protein 22 homolog n=1 Tax=Gongylonema pulchrum TaxID=637853 RepID=A0A183E8E6_9BILA